MDIVAHRVLYAIPTLALLLLVMRRFAEVAAALADRKVMLTLLGSVLLVLAHTSNLIACRCFSKSACDDSACGCSA